jgi:hypothetical protein
MAQAAKPILAFLIIGYGISVFVFEKDPLGLVLKNQTEEEALAADPRMSFKPRSAGETEMQAKRFIRPGVTTDDIERKFRTTGELMGPVYKRTFLIGESKFRQYRFPLGYGVIAYVLVEVFSQKVADHADCLKLNEPH